MVRTVFSMLFVFGLPLSIVNMAAGIFILILFAFGLVSGGNETVHAVMLLVMLALPVGFILSFFRPIFLNTKKEEVRAKPNDPVFIKWLAKKINKINLTIFTTKMFLVEIYIKHYTLTFRRNYCLLCFFMTLITVRMLTLVYTIEAASVIIAGSAVNLIMTISLGIAYWFTYRHTHIHTK